MIRKGVLVINVVFLVVFVVILNIISVKNQAIRASKSDTEYILYQYADNGKENAVYKGRLGKIFSYNDGIKVQVDDHTVMNSGNTMLIEEQGL